MKKKITITIICAVLSCVCLIGTTFAWLMDKTDPITNTFTVGDINITLEETKGTEITGARQFKMLPGNDIEKDPTVTVEAGSEACWLFVKIDKSANFGTYMTYTVDTTAGNWTLYSETTTEVVYYREVAATDIDLPFEIIKGNKVTVLSSVTKDMLEAAKTNAPTITFTAYAVQRDSNVDTAAEAWTIANS